MTDGGGRRGPRAPADELRRVGVVGCGLVGAGVAAAAARAGLDVVVVERDEASARAGRDRVMACLRAEPWPTAGRGPGPEPWPGPRAGHGVPVDAPLTTAAATRVHLTTELARLADRQLVVEAVTESEPEKASVLGAVDRVLAAPGAVLATSTSSLPVLRLALATRQPARVVGLQFFTPVLARPAVELVCSALTAPEAAARAASLAHRLDKRVVRTHDRAGFVVHALLIPYLLSAVRLVESGRWSAEEVDAGMVSCHLHPLGPLALADQIGLDTTMAVADSLYRQLGDARYEPPPLLARMVGDGLLGRKSGRGFYAYPDEPTTLDDLSGVG